jgi:hypothetical protein
VFGAYQGTREVNAATSVIYLPTASQRAGIFQGIVLDPYFNPLFQYYDQIADLTTIPLSALSPVNQKLLAYIPFVPTNPNPKLDGQYTQVIPTNFSENQYVVKADYIAGANRLFARYFGVRTMLPNVSLLPGSLLDQEGGASIQWQNGTVGYTWSHGNFLNDFRFTYLYAENFLARPTNPVTLDELGAKITPSNDKYISTQLAVGDFGIGQNFYGDTPRHNMDFADNLA